MGLSGNISFSGLMNGDIGETGGTTVVANPTGTATDTLNKIQVDETIYSVDGGGSSITITPSLESGTKVADYTIDETSGSLYAPTPTEYTAGTNVQISEENVISATDTTYTAGNNITIENGVISATQNENIYSTTETVIGKWVDNSNIYRICKQITNSLTLSANSWTQTQFDRGDIDIIITAKLITSSPAFLIVSSGIVSNKIALNSPRTIEFNPQTTMGYLILEYTKNS